MADGLSGTYNSACMARNMDNNPDRIEVINSKTPICGIFKKGTTELIYKNRNRVTDVENKPTVTRGKVGEG